MYKSIWDLVFKCNDSGIQFSSIQFSQEYSNQINMRKKNPRSRVLDYGLSKRKQKKIKRKNKGERRT
jgi:hypothetical protein